MTEEMFMKYMQRGGGEQLGDPDPTMPDEVVVQSSSGLIGRCRHFDRGSIYWTTKTGAWIVEDKIREYWQNRGAQASELGFPTSDQKDGNRGTVYSKFQRGTIYYFPYKDICVPYTAGKRPKDVLRWIAIIAACVAFVAIATIIGIVSGKPPLAITLSIGGALLSPLAGRLVAFIWPASANDWKDDS